MKPFTNHSEINLTPNPNWANLPLFDCKGWKRVRFGDVVNQLKEKVDPVEEGVERYVAGEHMETENVHIRKWGNVGEGYLGPAFIRRFRKGQVLYGSRRTYLKKVAMAEWDGVTANTTFVLEAMPEKLLPELLPWLMLSERFTQHSIAESKGSTNPYINFPDIAKFEFDLPPLEQQRRLADILWAIDQTTVEWAKVAERAKEARKTEMSALLNRDDFPKIRIGEAGEVQLGRQRSPKYQTGKFSKPYLRVANVFDGYIDYSDVLKMDFDDRDFRTFRLNEGDILLNEGQSRELVGRCALYDTGLPECCFQNTLVRYRVGERLLPAYAFACFQHYFYTGVFSSISSQTTSIAHLGADRFARLKISVPPIPEQKRVIAMHTRYSECIETSQVHRSSCTDMLFSLLNTIFR